MINDTALSLFRTYNGYKSGQEGAYGALLHRHFDEKGIPIDVIRFMRSQNVPVGSFLLQTLLRGLGNLNHVELDLIARMAISETNYFVSDVEDYVGSPEQNRVIDHSLTIYNTSTNFLGENAMARHNAIKNVIGNATTKIRNTPIAIIGKGPAGVMMFAALRALGFNSIRIYDKRATNQGIWGQENVRGGTKNNPRALQFHDNTLETARGDGVKDGAQVADFIASIAARNSVEDYNVLPVTKVVPGNLKHTLHIERDKQTEFKEFAIVINCAGTGKPVEFSDPERMQLIKGSSRPQAVRWQQQLERKDVKDKRFAFIGLGNSTAEMITQLNEFRSQGVNCDYRIFTHYPEDAVLNPTDSVYANGFTYRMFRDLSKPDLTGFQGDLPRSRSDYFQSLREDRIYGGIRQWGVKDGSLHAKGGGGAEVESYRFDKLYALTGYAQDFDELEAKYGIQNRDDAIVSDYDGEFRDGEGDILKGYFGLGALMDSSHDPNAVVIPGMMFRIPDLLFTIVCRAFEANAASE